MSRVTGKPPTATHWRRPMTRTYDYNMTLGENYYKPQLEYLATRRERGRTPPKATTFAERLLKYPPSRRSASASRRAEEEDIGISRATTRAEESMGRYASLDDLGLDEDLLRRRRQLLQASQENLAEYNVPTSPTTPRSRLVFGDKLLDAVGVRESGSSMSAQQSTSVASSSRSLQQKQTLVSSSSRQSGARQEDALDKMYAERKSRREIGSVQSAEADLFPEDPLKSPRVPLSQRLQSARQQADEMREVMKKDADATTSRFRSRLKARRAQEAEEDFGFESGAASKMTSSSTKSSSALKMTSQLSSSAQNLIDDDDAETAAILSKVEQIRKRAKARLAAISDDYPELQIESNLASRRAASRQAALDDEFDADFGSASKASSGRSVTISKRAVRASYDYE